MDDLPAEPKNLRFLRRLVTTLTATMILGIGAIFVLLFIRVQSETPERTLTLPPEIVLPDGAHAQAVTFGDGWYGVVTENQQFLIFDQATGDLRQSVDILN